MPVEVLSKELPKLEAKLSMLYEDKLEGIIDNTFFLKKKHLINYEKSLLSYHFSTFPPGTDLVRYKAIFAVNTITGISVLT